MTIPATRMAAVFEGPRQPMALKEFKLPQSLPDGAALCRIRLSTICGSDLHTVSGRRTEPVPSILGHESVGEVVAVGVAATTWSGEPLRVGARGCSLRYHENLSKFMLKRTVTQHTQLRG